MELKILNNDVSSSTSLKYENSEDINRNCTKNHLEILIANSFIGHDVSNADQKLSHVKNAFNYLDNVHPFVSLILQTVAASKEFQIIFHFNKKLNPYLDPIEEQTKRRNLLSTREIHIPAADLLNPNLIFDVYGILVHELCILALNLVYNNSCLPYYNKEKKVKKAFRKISDLCKFNRHKEDFINLVYFYPQDMQHSELIAQYSYMLVKYSKIPFKMEENRVNYPDLVQFCEDLVAKDMQMRIPDILNNKSRPQVDQDKSSLPFYIFTIILIFLLTFAIWLAVILTMPDIESLYSCGILTDDLQSKIFESTVDFQGVNVIFVDLFGRNSSACEHLSPQEVTRMLKVFDSGKFVDNYTGIYRNFTADENLRIAGKVNPKWVVGYKKIIDENMNQVIYEEKNRDSQDNIYMNYMNKKFREPALKIHQKVQNRTKFYIERIVKLPNPSSAVNSGIPYGFNTITKMKLLLLSDKGGSGKSTYFRHMAWKLKRRFPLKWISYVDLKQHVPVLQDVPKTDANLTTLVDFLSSKILNLTSKVEIEVFGGKFLSNDSIFLWDGVDEVGLMDFGGILRLDDVNIENKINEKVADLARKSKFDNLLSLIEIISKLTNNKQWIAARPHLEDAITYKLGIKAHNFVEFDEDDKKEFLEKFIETEGLIHQNVSKNLEDIKRLTQALKKRLKETEEKVWQNFDKNVKIFEIICEFYFKNETNLNLYKIYEEYFHTILLDTYGISKNDSTWYHKLDMLSKTHQHFAVAQILNYPVYNIFIGEFDSKCKDVEINNLTIIFDIFDSGVVHKNEEKIIFEDKIFQDFFIAQYFFNNVWNLRNISLDENEADCRLEFLFYMFLTTKSPYQIVTEHMIGFIESYENQVDPEFNEVFSVLMCENYPNLFLTLTYVDASERIEIATKFFKKDTKIIDCLWKVNENRTFFHRFLEISTKSDKVTAMKKVVDDNFSKKVAQKIVSGKYQSANFLSILWQNRWNLSDTNAISNAVNYYFDIKKLQSIRNLQEFLDFLLNQNNFSKEEIREFFHSNLNFLKKNDDEIIYKKYAKKMLNTEDYDIILKIWGCRDFVSEFDI